MSCHVSMYSGSHEEWDKFVDSFPDASGYFYYVWRDIFENSFGHSTYYLAARECGNIVGILPLVHMKSILFGNFLISLPFVTYGGLLFRNHSARDCILDAAELLRRKIGARYIELRHTAAGELNLPSRKHKVSMMLELLDDAAGKWSSFAPKVRNQVRKAQKSGLEVSWGKEEFLDDFYSIFVRNMRDLGTPVYAKSFFKNVLISLPSNTLIIMVRLGAQPIAAGMLYWHGQTLEIPWASSIRSYNSLCPNNLMYWEVIRHAYSLGLKRFDLGRSTSGAGTYKFKEQWGAKPESLSWNYILPDGENLPDLTNQNPTFSLAIAAWRRLPLFITRIIGPSIVRCIP